MPLLLLQEVGVGGGNSWNLCWEMVTPGLTSFVIYASFIKQSLSLLSVHTRLGKL